MVSNSRSRWVVAGSTFALWALLAASAAFWALKISATHGAAAAPVVTRVQIQPDPAVVARLLGAAPTVGAAPAASLSSRFALIGVVSSPTRQGAALISVDGKPAKPFRVGANIDEGLVLQSVESRRAVLAASADGPAMLTLELPPRK
jgi:general secretion pathway protein C